MYMYLIDEAVVLHFRQISILNTNMLKPVCRLWVSTIPRLGNGNLLVSSAIHVWQFPVENKHYSVFTKNNFELSALLSDRVTTV